MSGGSVSSRSGLKGYGEEYERQQKYQKLAKAYFDIEKKVQEKEKKVSELVEGLVPTDQDPCNQNNIEKAGPAGAQVVSESISVIDQNGNPLVYQKVSQVTAMLVYEPSTSAKGPGTYTRELFNKPLRTRTWQPTGSPLPSPLGYSKAYLNDQGIQEEFKDWENDQVGHIIGNQFGGYANRMMGIGNIFPQAVKSNSPEQRDYENELARFTKAGNHQKVCVQINFTFADPRRPVRPTLIKFQAWVDREPHSFNQGNGDIQNPSRS